MSERTMTAQERLNTARTAAHEGKYSEALSEYIWFHNHALEERPSLRGVRLSFALGYWLELAGKYPPARSALKDIREEKTRRLLEGAEDWELFNDVHAINRTLSNDEATYDLFCAINSKNPDFAARCARIAMPVMVKAHDFKLARSFITDPELAIESHASQFKEGIERARSKPTERQADIIEVEVRIYSEAVSMLADIVGWVGEPARADAMIEHAIALAGEGKVRDAVRKALGL